VCRLRVGTGLKGDMALIVELILYHKGNRKKPLKVSAIIREINGKAFGINKLKEANDLMDIEMMTRDEFDKLKEESAPIIKGD
jgi:hypothetical protein